MYPAGRYNLNFNISAILLTLFLLIIYFRKKDRSELQNRIFIAIIFILNISGILDLISTIMRNDPEILNPGFDNVITFFSHLLHNSLAYVYALYIIYTARVNYLMKTAHRVLLALPELILIVFSMVPPLRALLYTISPDGGYSHGPWYELYFVIVGIYFIITVCVLIKYREIFGADLIFICIFFAGIILSSFLSALYPYLRATIFVQSVCALGSFIIIENEKTIYDKESGALSRYALISEAEVIYAGPFRSFVISVKLHNLDYYVSVFGMRNVFGLLKGITAWLRCAGGKNAKVYFPVKGSFTVILYNTSWEEGMKIAEEIRLRFRKKWDVPGVNTVVPAQVWATNIPDRIKTPDQLVLFSNAPFDKKLGDGVHVIDGKSEENRYMDVKEAIKRGIRKKLLQVYYQPVLDTATGTFRSAEALVRYTDEILGPIPPKEFISVAEQMGVIGKVGEIVFNEVCRFSSEVHPEQYGIDFISVNLSAVQCMDENLPRKLSDIAAKYGTNARRINLEINESIFSYNEAMMENAVNSLRQNGFFISLDDFGNGNTNLNDLIKYPFSIIKIDRNVLWAAGSEEKKDKIMTHIIQMIKDLGFKVVVEGVENEEQREKLMKLEVEYLQGFLYSLPVSRESFFAMISDAQN